MKHKIKEKIFNKVIWWSGMVMIGFIFSMSLQLTQAADGACYTSYGKPPALPAGNRAAAPNDWCLTGFVDKGSIGKWGACTTGLSDSFGNYGFFRPPRGVCTNWATGNTVYTVSFDEAHKCCR
jgi:hypothetical protein